MNAQANICTSIYPVTLNFLCGNALYSGVDTASNFNLIMIDFQQFEDVFGSKSDTSYHQQSIDDIVRNRQRLDNELFVDRLLKTLGIDKGRPWMNLH